MRKIVARFKRVLNGSTCYTIFGEIQDTFRIGFARLIPVKTGIPAKPGEKFRQSAAAFLTPGIWHDRGFPCLTLHVESRIYSFLRCRLFRKKKLQLFRLEASY